MQTFFQDIAKHFRQLWEKITFNFPQLKTSTQISLKFTLFTVLQVLLFSILANAIFFQNWYNRQQGLLPPTSAPIAIQKMVLGKNRMPETEIFAINSDE